MKCVRTLLDRLDGVMRKGKIRCMASCPTHMLCSKLWANIEHCLPNGTLLAAKTAEEIERGYLTSIAEALQGCTG